MSDTWACRHGWEEVPAKTSTGATTLTRCTKCKSYRFERRPAMPAGDMYFIQETTPRDEEDNDGAR